MESGFFLLFDLIQHCKPDWRSYFVLISHLSFVPCLSISWKRGLRVEFLSIVLTLIISILYHLCDENIYCFYFPTVHPYHAFDVFFTFFLVGILSVYLCDLSPDNEVLLRSFLTCVSLILVVFDRFSVLVNLLLWAIPVSCVMYRNFLQPHRRCRWQDVIIVDPPYPRIKKKYLFISLFFLFLATTCFVLANASPHYFFGISRQHYASKLRRCGMGGGSLLTAPESGFYWLFHGLWHAISMIAVYFVLLSKEEREQSSTVPFNPKKNS